MGYIPIFAWTFFFIFFTALLSFHTLRQARRRKSIALESIKLLQSQIAQISLPASVVTLVQQLESVTWQDTHTLIELADFTNREQLANENWIAFLTKIKEYQVADKAYKHLVKYQPTKLVAGILRWS